MIGAIAGDIIGSPYMFENFEDPNMFIRLRPFEENRFARFVDGMNSAISADDLNRLSRKEQKRYILSEDEVHEATPTHFTAESGAVASALMHGDEGASVSDTLSETLTIGVLCGEWAATADEAVRLAQSFVRCNQLESHALQGAIVTAHAVWMASHGHKAEEIKGVMESVYGLTFMDLDSHSLVLKGQFVMSENGKMDIGDGIKRGELSIILPAALDCVLASRSFDEAVMRAVAIGGRSNLVGAMAGAFSEHIFGVPSDIRRKAMQYLDSDMRDLVEVFEQKAKNIQDRIGNTESVSNELSVIKIGQKSPIYVIPEGRLDMEEAAKRICRKTGLDCVIIRPDELQATLEKLSAQRDGAGRELSGTFIETVRPECYRLWFEEGQFKSSKTRNAVGDETLPSIKIRSNNFNSFEQLKAFAVDVRKELERQAGHDGNGHVHFATAFYPVVYSRSIDLMEGDILRGRVKYDDQGRIKVDTNVNTGRSTGEYLQGVLESMDIFHRNDGVAEIKQKLNEYCLDYGKIEDEDERVALRSDDQEAASVKMKYASNIDRAVFDMSQVSELAVAVEPVLTIKEQKRVVKRAEIAQESAERYEGKTRRMVEDSSRYQGSVFTVGHSNHDMDSFKRLLVQYGIDTVIDVRSFPTSKNFPHFNSDVIKESLTEAGVDYRYSGKEMGGHVSRESKDQFELYCLEGEGTQPQYRFFKNDSECLDWCRKENKSLPASDRFTSYTCMTDEQINEYLKSDSCDRSIAAGIEIYKGKDLTYSEVMNSPDFKAELKSLRDMVKEGRRVAVMCMEGDPEQCHRFSMIGYALAHPTDGRIKPLDVQHITRQGILLSQDYLEKKLVKSYGLSEDPKGLEKSIEKKCFSNLLRKRNDYKASVKNKGGKSQQNRYKGKKL